MLAAAAAIAIALPNRFGAGKTERPNPSAAPETPPATQPAPSLRIERSQTPTDPLSAETLRVADRLLEQFPFDPRALTVAGRIYYSFGDESAAVACWENALALDPQLGGAWHALGEAAWHQGDYRNAAELLRKAIHVELGLEARVAYMLADSLANLGEAREAAEVLERADAENALRVDGRLLLGHSYLQLAQHQRAKEQFQRVLAADPASSKAHFGLTTVFTRLNQPAEAEKHRQEYAQLQSENVEQNSRLRKERRGQDIADLPPLASQCFLNAGKVFALQGDATEAERLWQRAVELAPQNSDAKALLRALYVQQGRREEAGRIQP
jgi:tetratricopeptide (TPR) repeat protein